MIINNPLLLQLQHGVEQHQPSTIDRSTAIKAAVLVAITNEQNPQLILTQRADHLTLHAGEVALPGGKSEKDDKGSVQTALREAEEEIGLTVDQVHVVGELDACISRLNYLITPVVGFVDKDVKLTSNPSELSAIFRVPLRWFIEEPVKGHSNKKGILMPSYHYQGFKIWGITAFIILRMLNQYLEANINIGFDS
jgi:8-oxo-dGTP pyrophosphatase MutT (NUDIX family)